MSLQNKIIMGATMQNGSIDIKTIPQKYIKDIKEAGINFASDGNPNNLSTIDFIKTSKNMDYAKYVNMLEKLDPFLTWFFENNTGKACTMENELKSDNSTNLAAYFHAVYSKLKATAASRNILRKKNISLVLDKDIPLDVFKNADLNFKITDGKLIITGREFKSKSWLGSIKEYKDFKLEINKPQLSTLKEIKIKNSKGDSTIFNTLEGTSEFQYVLSAVYKDGKEIPIVVLDKYTGGGSGSGRRNHHGM